jgi:RHS repeat-associated protein
MLIARSRTWALLCLVLAALTANATNTTTYEFHSAKGLLLLDYIPAQNASGVEQTLEYIYLGDKRIAQRSFNNRTASASSCAFDITGEGNLDAAIDGLLITRYALGFRGTSLIAGISTTPALNATTLETKLQSLTTVPSGSPVGSKPKLDLDGDGRVLGSTDALMIHRFLRNIKGDALTSKAFNPAGTRNATNEISPYIASICEKNPIPAGESISYFHNDIGGTPQVATDASGTVLWKESYKPYGERTTNALASEGGKGTNELYFHGKKAETQLNGGVTLQYFGRRYFDPQRGQFNSIDPVGFTESSVHSFNRYAYGNNNPYRYVDPDGSFPGLVLLAGAAAAAPAMITGGARLAPFLQRATASAMGMAQRIAAHPATLHAIEAAEGLMTGGPSSGVASGAAAAGAFSKAASIHHICTNKNCISTATGGPWTPRFEALFEKAGLSLEDAINKAVVVGHQGPHPQAYHQEIFRRISQATSGLSGGAYQQALQHELGAISAEITTTGSTLNKMVTKQ